MNELKFQYYSIRTNNTLTHYNVTKILHILLHIIYNNKDIDVSKKHMNVFTCENCPPITLLNYVHRLFTYSHRGGSELKSHVANSIIYLIRYYNSGYSYYNNDIYKLFGVSYMISIKLHSDMYPNNTYFATLMGIDLEECNLMERDFLKLIDWKLYTNHKEFKTIFDLIDNGEYEIIDQVIGDYRNINDHLDKKDNNIKLSLNNQHVYDTLKKKCLDF